MSETKKLQYTVSFQPNNVGNFTPDIIIFKTVSHLKIILESSGELCQVKQRGGFGSKKRRNERRHERIQKKPIGNEKEEENEKEEKNEKKEEDEKDIDNEREIHRKKLEEWRNKREIRKATRPTYPVKYKNVAEIINAHESAMKDKNLGNVQNPTYPMDKNIGTNIKNVAEVTNSHESAKFKSTPDRAPADVGRVDRKQIRTSKEFTKQEEELRAKEFTKQEEDLSFKIF